MSESIERALEETVPLLRYTKKLKLLTDVEIRAIVRKRRDHEYALRRTTATRTAFLRYAAFEKNLAKKLNDRIVSKKLSQKRARSIASQQSARVHLVYSRAIRKFKGDDLLYLQYANYCVTTGSSKSAQKVLARAIAHRSDSERVWLAAVAFHFDTCGDTAAARTLAQRALRTLKSSKILWKEYFRMELLYLTKLLARRIAIVASVPGDDSTDGVVRNQQDVSSAEQLQFWTGGVPFVIFRSAMVESDLSLTEAIEFLDIAASVKLAPADLLAAIHSLIMNVHGESSSPVLSFLTVRRDYDVALALLTRQRAVVEAFQPSESSTLSKANDIDMSGGVSDMAAARDLEIKLMGELQDALHRALSGLESIIQNMQTISDLKEQSFSSMATKFINSMKAAKPTKHLKALGSRCQKLLTTDSDLPSSGMQDATSNVEELQKSLTPENWSQFLAGPGVKAFESGDEQTLGSLRRIAAQTAAIPFRNKQQDDLCLTFLRWERDYGCLCVFVDVLLNAPPLTKDFVMACIQAEWKFAMPSDSLLAGAESVFDRIRSIFEKGVTVMAAKVDVEFWLRYALFERDVAKNARNASIVIWRAQRALSPELRVVFDERLLLQNLLNVSS